MGCWGDNDFQKPSEDTKVLLNGHARCGQSLRWACETLPGRAEADVCPMKPAMLPLPPESYPLSFSPVAATHQDEKQLIFTQEELHTIKTNWGQVLLVTCMVSGKRSASYSLSLLSTSSIYCKAFEVGYYLRCSEALSTADLRFWSGFQGQRFLWSTDGSKIASKGAMKSIKENQTYFRKA